MERGETGRYEASVCNGQTCRAFVPDALPPAPPLQLDGDLRERWDAAHLALGRLDSVTMLMHDPQLFLYAAIRKEAVLSSGIEGTQSSLSDLLLYENDAAPGVPLNDVREVLCYVQALTTGLARIREGWPISTPLLWELHATLLREGRGANAAPGEFRRVQNWISGRNGFAFVPPPPQAVPQCWSDLEKFFNDVATRADVPTRHAPLLKAALGHVQFETIHPFHDGNGRLGRLLIPLILLRENLVSEPMLYLSLHFKTHRDEYYELLQNVRETGDWERWLAFFADAVISTANGATQTIRELHALIERDATRLRELGRLAGSAQRILRALARRPISSAATLRVETDLSAPTVQKLISELRKAGLVHELTGQKRGRVYVYSEYLNVLNRS